MVGTRERKKMQMKTVAMPQRGRLRKKSQRHAPEPARAPPIGGPTELRRSQRTGELQAFSNIPGKCPYTMYFGLAGYVMRGV